MSANPNLNQSTAETHQSNQTDCSNGAKAPAQPKRRRNRPNKSKKASEPSRQNGDAQKSKEPGKEEKFVHTVFGGMSKEKFNKQKETRLSHQSKSSEQKELVSRSIQRKVTVTANKSVIVSILEPALNQNGSKGEEKNVNISKTLNYSSSLNEAHLVSRINDQTSLDSNADQGQMDKNYVFEFELEKNYVYRIKKSKTDKFRCNICNYFCDTIEVARKHINGPIHRNNLDTIKLEMRIRELELPCEEKLSNLSEYLLDFYTKNVISSDKMNQYYDIYLRFKEKYTARYPQAVVNITGSVAHGVAFSDTSCDISVEHESKTSLSSPEILCQIKDFIKIEMSDVFDCKCQPKAQTPNKMSKFSASSNKLTLVTLKTNLVFNFITGLHSYSYKTNYLIKSLISLDERARVLAFCFRYLAKIAQIDKVDYCTLPPHAYLIMCIYFLQKLNPPVLPVLHELCDSKKLSKSRGTGIDNSDQEELPDGDNSKNDKDSVHDFDIFRKNVNLFVSSNNWLSQNECSIGELWLKLLTFYSIDFGFKKTLISIRRSARISKSSMKMYTKKISIEDPFYLKQSLSRNLMTQTNKYIISVISKACLYFVNSSHYNKTVAVRDADKKNMSIVDKLIEETGILDARKTRRDLENASDIDSESDDDDDESLMTESDTESDYVYKKKEKQKTDDSDGQGPSLVSSVDNYSSLSTPFEMDQSDKFFFDDKYAERSCLSENSPSSISKQNLNEKFNSLRISVDDNEINECLNDLIDCIVDRVNYLASECVPNVKISSNSSNQTFAFKFSQNSINFAKNPPKICSHCNKEGHLMHECPQDQLPELDKLPEMTDEWRQVISNVCFCIMDDNKQTREEEVVRNNLLQNIRAIIGQKYPDARLSLFGSSNNGFAMKKSDLDICMTLDNNPHGQELNPKKIIRTIGALFRRDTHFDQIEERVSAKVPIVKFRHKKTNIEGDISLYNTLALQNTDLLRSYVQIDSRLQVLGHVVKYFAKICRIGDASCGSLSSYAYIVMMLHYLMKTEPPVLPCLQKLNRDKFADTKMEIDGWDCWFFRDLENLHVNWPHYKKNNLSVGELWLGFLRYYTEVFDWENHVVCIRDSNLLTRKEKNWTKHRLAIEDPFELSHNLAAGVSHKMGLYILRSFAKARSVFGSIVSDFRSNEIRFNMDYFFNPRSLVEGNPPMDRNCYSCMKIGHQTKDCPLANAKRRERQLSDMFDGRQDSLLNLVCYRCNFTGHKAKDCPGDLKRNKTASFSNDLICFKCNMLGHYARECMLNQGKIQIQPIFPVASQQKSAPPPKMISLVSNAAHPIVFHNGDKTQLIVNNSSSVNSASSNSSIPNQSKHYQNGKTLSNNQNILLRQQSYPNQYPKTHSEHIYHQNNQFYNIMGKEFANGQFHSPSKQYSFTFTSPIGANNGYSQSLTNQYLSYHHHHHHRYIVYNNPIPSPQISEYKIFGANFGSFDEKKIDLDIVQLNSNNFTKP